MSRFRSLCAAVFEEQVARNPLYARWTEALGCETEAVAAALRDPRLPLDEALARLPFLPIETFKTERVYAAATEPELRFESSATGGMQPSVHYIASAALYRKSLLHGFTCFYGPAAQYCFLGLLPQYLERPHSSLVYMVQTLMDRSGHPLNGYFLYDHRALYARLMELKRLHQPTVLFGLSAALLDFAADYVVDFPELVVIETGGMKKDKRVLSREALHAGIGRGFPARSVHSEYSMAELLSQAYAQGGGLYRCPPWMRVHIRSVANPLAAVPTGEPGAVCIVDLANRWSCPFIATQDSGLLHPSGAFEIMGRLPAAEVRGCNMLLG